MFAIAQAVSIAATLVVVEQQSPIGPVRLEPPTGGGNPIVVSVTGVEQDPVPVTGRWSADDKCLAEIDCFVSSWIEANSSGSLEHLLTLRAPAERADVERRLRQALSLNTSRFNAVRKWSLLGWADYGTFRIVLLVREQDGPPAIYTLPLQRVGSHWAQTDALATDAGVYEIFDRIGKAILQRHRTP